MGRSAKMEGAPTDDGDLIRQAADEYDELETELLQKRAATKETTGSKTAWSRRWVEKRVDPVVLADAVALIRKLEANPEKTTRDWRLFISYLNELGFKEKLMPDLFDGDAERSAA